MASTGLRLFHDEGGSVLGSCSIPFKQLSKDIIVLWLHGSWYYYGWILVLSAMLSGDNIVTTVWLDLGFVCKVTRGQYCHYVWILALSARLPDDIFVTKAGFWYFLLYYGWPFNITMAVSWSCLQCYHGTLSAALHFVTFLLLRLQGTWNLTVAYDIMKQWG